MLRISLLLTVFWSFAICISIHAHAKEPLAKTSSSDTYKELTQADELFAATLYTKAIPIYQNYLRNKSTEDIAAAEILKKTREKLAKAYALTNDYSNLIKLLESHPNRSLNDSLLLAMAYRKVQQYREAKEELEKCLKSNNDPQIRYELGLTYYLWGQFVDARKQFDALLQLKIEPEMQIKAKLYLARLDIQEEKYKSALSLLNLLQNETKGILKFEVSYLLGTIHFKRENYHEAIDAFLDSLPTANPDRYEWHFDTLYYLGWSYLRLAEEPGLTHEEMLGFFEKSESAFKQYYKKSDRMALSLGQCYLSWARCLQNPNAYKQAEQLFSQKELFSSPNSYIEALLLQAGTAPTYEEREMFYEQLMQQEWPETSFFAKGSYLRALNHLEKGQSLLLENQPEEAHKVFEKAITFFQKAFESIKNKDEKLSGEVFKCRLLTAHYSKTKEALTKAYVDSEHFLKNDNAILQSIENPDEIYYLFALSAAWLAEYETENELYKTAERILKEALQKYPQGKFEALNTLFLGKVVYKQLKYLEAKQIFSSLDKDSVPLEMASEGLFWAAKCADHLGHLDIAKNYRLKLCENYPHSAFAAEAFFNLHSFQDYLLGDRSSVKHLEAMTSLYPESPLSLPAWYLIGLDYKQDRKTPEGKWIRKKNLTAAIDAFQKVESLFEDFSQNHIISAETSDYYLSVCYQAMLERAIANLAIADKSQGAKRQIYLEYAEEVLSELIQKCSKTKKEWVGSIIDETSYSLAKAYLKANKFREAELLWDDMISKYQKDNITRNYLLSRVWYEKGSLALQEKQFEQALKHFQQAEEAAKGKVLNSEQKLDLLIQQSVCYQNLKDFDNALLILSKVINEDCISALRIKAMFLRAEIYELQNRFELARRQLEFVSKNGGEWGLKALEKLEKNYGYTKDHFEQLVPL